MRKVQVVSILLVFLFCWTGSIQAQEIFEYLSPRPGAILVSAGTTIAVRQGTAIKAASLNESLFVVTGGQSGLHSGQVILADDGQTVIFKPGLPFAPAEVVTVTIQSGIETTTGQILSGIGYTFTVSPKPVGEVRTPTATLGIGDWQTTPATPEVAELGRGAKGNYATVPADFPFANITSPANGADDGLIFFSNFKVGGSPAPYAVIMDDNGEPIFYRKLTPLTLNTDFRKQANGLLTYYDAGVGLYLALDDSYQVVDTYQAGNGYTIDLHGIHVAENGHILLQIYDPQSIDMSQIIPDGLPNATVIGAVIQELDASRNVIFEWRSWDHFAITDASDALDLTTQNLSIPHMNAVEWDTDGNILASFRHLDEITKIDRSTADIIWRMGGKKNQFTFIGEDRPFSHQHDIRRLPNGNITMYDNGNSGQPPYSRAVEYQLDEVNKTVTKVWEYRHQPTDLFGAFTGSVQRLPNGNTAISWGGNSTPLPIFTEVKADGSKAFEFYLDNGEQSYRAFRQTWEGHPVEPPSLVLESQATTSTLHYSWNGATEIASYRVYGGTTSTPDTLIDLPVKEGFETTTVLSQTVTGPCYFYRVMPVDKSGDTTTYSNSVFAGDETCEIAATATPDGGITKTFTASTNSLFSATLSVPTGAVSETTTLLYTLHAPGSGQTPPDGLANTEMLINVTAYRGGNPLPDFVFNTPVAIQLDYASYAVAGTIEETMAAYRWNREDQQWSTDGLPVVDHDQVNNRLVFTTTKLGDFALFAQPSGEPISQTQVIQDSSFEADPSLWQQKSNNLPFVICDNKCNYSGASEAHIGEHWVAFRGGMQAEDAYVRQTLALPFGRVLTATLSFWFKIPVPSKSGVGTLSVSLDGTEIFTVEATQANATTYSKFTKLSFDLSDQVRNGRIQLLSFDASIQAQDESVFYIDDATLTLEGYLIPEKRAYLAQLSK